MWLKGLAVVTGIGALAFVLAFLVTVGSDRGITETIEHSREIARTFETAKSFVDDFAQRAKRLPTNEEFEGWKKTKPQKPYGVTTVYIRTKVFPAEVEKRFGAPPAETYLLEFWRGEWFEYYAPWANASTLTFDPQDYYLFRSRFLNSLAFLIGSLAFGILTLFLWRRPTNRLQRTVPCAARR